MPRLPLGIAETEEAGKEINSKVYTLHLYDDLCSG